MTVRSPIRLKRSEGVGKRSFVSGKLENDVRKAINGGFLKPGDPILSISELSREYGLKQPTVQKALGRLEKSGYLATKPGVGTFVASRANIRISVSEHSILPDIISSVKERYAPELQVVSATEEADLICKGRIISRYDNCDDLYPLKRLELPNRLFNEKKYLPRATERYVLDNEWCSGRNRRQFPV